ncbi:DUF5723 family protein [Bacteroidota bacterium]
MNTNTFKKSIFTILSVILIAGYVSAQDAQTLYYMNRIPQSTLMNPAMQPKCNFFLGLPVVSSLQMDAGNNRLSLTDVIMKHPTEDSLITFLHPDAEFNTTDFLSKLDENNFFYEDFRTDLLSFGFRVKTWYFSFNLSEKFSTSINYPKDLMVLALEGNRGVNSSFYREYGIGISKEINQMLSIGIRGKVLFGHANVYSDFNNNDFSLYSSRDSIYLNADATVYTSSPMIATINSDGDFDGFEAPTYIEDSETDSLIDLALAHNNMGLGIDFGIYLKPIERLSLSLSVIDLGYIKWDVEDVTKLNLNGSYAFKGIDVSDEVGNSDSDTDAFDDMLDSIENSFTVANTAESYTTSLGTKIYIGANFAVSKKFDIGFLSRSYYYNNNLNQAFTFSANTHMSGLSFSLSYSIMNGSYNNVGFGLTLGGAPLQIYIISDNASAALWGHKTTSFNFRFGLNIAFGYRQKAKKMDTPLLKSVF